jgi:hypothetical protein
MFDVVTLNDSVDWPLAEAVMMFEFTPAIEY